MTRQRPDLPDLPPPAFEASDALAKDELMRRLDQAGARFGFVSRKGKAERPSPQPTKTIQLVVPDYLFEQLHLDAAKRRVTKKHIILKALQAAGYQIEAGDLDEDGRRNR
jgi:hypothetical protein